ncbi:MAG: class I SAM-dependent methyltransferase [Saprospiraceae bacterium]
MDRSKYEKQFEANKHGWNLRTPVHLDSAMYNVEEWKKGGVSLKPVELTEVGSVEGKTVLHLLCHFGQDTLSWARLGAEVTGVDLSDEAIANARRLSDEIGVDGRFICCNVYDLPQHLDEQFDIVFCSFGVLGWLPELEPWAEIVAKYVKPGGFFYLADFHPIVWMLDEEFDFIKYPYHNAAVIETDNHGTYSDRDADIHYKEYGWNHSLSELMNSFLKQGMRIDFFNEHNYSPHNCFPKTVEGPEGQYKIKGLEDVIPLFFSIKCSKPA